MVPLRPGPRERIGGNRPFAPPHRVAGWRPLGFVACIIAATILSPPTVMVLWVGMIPTIVAFVVDRTPGRSAAVCVGAPNFAGVLPFLLQIWLQNHSAQAAEAVLTNVFALIVMYGAAAIGWILFAMVPSIVGASRNVMAQRRVAQLRARQKELIEEWGADVANPFEQSARGKRTSHRARTRLTVEPDAEG